MKRKISLFSSAVLAVTGMLLTFLSFADSPCSSSDRMLLHLSLFGGGIACLWLADRLLSRNFDIHRFADRHNL